MVRFVREGDLLDQKVDALVNTVNCVGVMGRGVALQFKQRFPETQCEVVDRLLTLANRKEKSGLVISTHSPYVVNHLQLVAQAEEVARKSGMSDEVVGQLPIPRDALTAAADIRLYEMHLDGSITLAQGEDGFISDANPLNRSLAEFNEQYAQMFEIEDLHA